MGKEGRKKGKQRKVMRRESVAVFLAFRDGDVADPQAEARHDPEEDGEEVEEDDVAEDVVAAEAQLLDDAVAVQHDVELNVAQLWDNLLTVQFVAKQRLEGVAENGEVRDPDDGLQGGREWAFKKKMRSQTHDLST
jgi:hypothetical protein